MGGERDVDLTAQWRAAGWADTSPLPKRPQPPYPEVPISALIAARKKLDDDTTSTWLLVGLAALSGFLTVGYFAWIFTPVFLFPFAAFPPWDITGGSSSFDAVAMVLSIIGWIGISLILPLLVVVGANRAYRRQYDMVTAELVHGDMALMLIDESYGRMIQEWRERRYRPAVGEVHLGSTLAGRLIHFAAYYPHYFRLARGQREFAVQPAVPLNCWMDGLLVWCLGCNAGCYWLIVPLPLRVVYTYPKSIATRRAVLDYFYGKWDHALEENYRERGKLASPTRNWE